MQDATSRARNLLRKKYPDEFRKYYNEIVAELMKTNISSATRRGRARSKAKTVLVKQHPEDFKVLRKVAIAEGCPVSSAFYPKKNRREDS